MDDRANANDVGTDTQSWLGHVPKVSDALKKGVVVGVATWGGRDLTGTSSIERVNIGAVAPRRGKVLHS